MKTTKLLAVVLISCFILGIGLSAVIPGDVSATSDICNRRCSRFFHCGMVPPGPIQNPYPCPEGYYPIAICYLPAGAVCNADFSAARYTCGCTQVGCEIEC